MDSGQDSAECSMCHQLVNFEPSEGDADGAQAVEPAAKADAPKVVSDTTSSPQVEEPAVTASWDQPTPKPDEPARDENAAEEPLQVPSETPAQPVDSPASGESHDATPVQEEKFRKTDEAYTDRKSIRKQGTRSRKRRRIKKPGSKPEEFGWESDKRRGRRRSDRQTVFFVSGSVVVMVLLMTYLVSKSQVVETESYESRAERERQEELMAQQASSMKEFLSDVEVKPRPQWQVDFQNSPEKFIRKLKPILEGFLEAKTWEERLKYCADAEMVRPLMKDYYEQNEDGPYDYQDMFVGNTVSVGKFFITSSILMGDYSNRSFVMLREDDGSWSVDWESFVGYSTMGMVEFKNQRPTEPQLFRLTIARPRPGYFNYKFSDEQSWDCYVLYGSDAGEVLYAYVKKFGKESSALKDVLALNEVAAVTVMVRFPEDSPTDNQVEIVEVVGKGWVPRIQRETENEVKEDAGQLPVSDEI